jgi:hypothetical protein
MTRFQLLTDCICLAPCKGRCDVCGVVLCKMTKHWKSNCDICASWFFAVFDKYLGTNLYDSYVNF